MTEIKQHEAQTPDATPTGVHKSWMRTKVTAATLALSGFVCSTTYITTLFAGYLEKYAAVTQNMDTTTTNAIHGTARSLGVGGAVGYIGTIVLFLGTAAAAYDEFTHYNE